TLRVDLVSGLSVLDRWSRFGSFLRACILGIRLVGTDGRSGGSPRTSRDRRLTSTGAPCPRVPTTATRSRGEGRGGRAAPTDADDHGSGWREHEPRTDLRDRDAAWFHRPLHARILG